MRTDIFQFMVTHWTKRHRNNIYHDSASPRFFYPREDMLFWIKTRLKCLTTNRQIKFWRLVIEVNILYLLCLTTIKNGYRRYPPYFQIQVERLGDLARSMITGWSVQIINRDFCNFLNWLDLNLNKGYVLFFGNHCFLTEGKEGNWARAIA